MRALFQHGQASKLSRDACNMKVHNPIKGRARLLILILADERPPSWSKILAAKHYLKDHDWVMWLDADTIVTNPEIRLESLLPRSTSGPDFVITVDGGGYNAGIWLLRSTAWSYDFLDRWWNMKHHITVRIL